MYARTRPHQPGVTIHLLAGAVVGLLLLAPTAAAQEGDPRAFATGYRIVNDSLWEAFTAYGGADMLGAPISREFTLQGAQMQLFEKSLLRVEPGGAIQPVSLMGAEWLPYTHFGGLTLPPADPALAFVTPRPEQPSYPVRLDEFVRTLVPDVWQGLPVAFQSHGAGTAGSLWAFGAPTSSPTADPNNPHFVYQRFERGVLMFNAADGGTGWLPMGEALEALLTGADLPPDLAAEAEASPLWRLYDPSRPFGLSITSAGASAPPSTDLTDAFTPDPIGGS